MEADNLTYIMFFIGCGISFMVPAMAMTNIKPHILMSILASIAGLFFLMALGWPSIRTSSPQFASFVIDTINNPNSWFLAIGVSFIIYVFGIKSGVSSQIPWTMMLLFAIIAWSGVVFNFHKFGLNTVRNKVITSIAILEWEKDFDHFINDYAEKETTYKKDGSGTVKDLEDIRHNMSEEFRKSFISNYIYLRDSAMSFCKENCYATTFDDSGDITYYQMGTAAKDLARLNRSLSK
jgi:hypothetical protein